MKTLTFIFLTVVIFSHSLWAQKGIVINSGAVLKMNGNVYLKLSGDHNFTNYSTQNQLGGTVVFSGTSEQTISGSEPSEFSNLDINNPNGVILGNDITIANELMLNSGILNINNFNLFMSESADITGSFSSDNFINVDGNGYLVKNISGNGIYFFPVGDMTSGNDYSPAELNFIEGSYTNGTVSIQLKNTKHPDNTSITNYINRYWTIQSNGISGFDVNVDLTFVPGDIVGMESEIFGGLWNSTSWFQLNPASSNHITGSVTNFGDFTGVDAGLFVGIDELEANKIAVNWSDGNLFIYHPGQTEYFLINIYSSNGQLINSSGLETSDLIRVPFSAAKGLYILELISEKSNVHIPFLVN
jgi:hypothetical protein